MVSGWIRAVVSRRAYGARTFGPVAVALRQPRYLKDDERWFRPRRSETVSEPPLRLLREGLMESVRPAARTSAWIDHLSWAYSPFSSSCACALGKLFPLADRVRMAPVSAPARRDRHETCRCGSLRRARGIEGGGGGGSPAVAG